ncbi:hypothetical protein [Clostridium sp. DL1XJH146]
MDKIYYSKNYIKVKTSNISSTLLIIFFCVLNPFLNGFTSRGKISFRQYIIISGIILLIYIYIVIRLRKIKDKCYLVIDDNSISLRKKLFCKKLDEILFIDIIEVSTNKDTIKILVKDDTVKDREVIIDLKSIEEKDRLNLIEFIVKIKSYME